MPTKEVEFIQNAKLRDGEHVVAAARALFLEVSLEHFARGGRVPESWQHDWEREGRVLPY